MSEIDWVKFETMVQPGCQCQFLSDNGDIKIGILQEARPYCSLDGAADCAAARELLSWAYAEAQDPGTFLSIQLFEDSWVSGDYIPQMPASLLQYFIDGKWQTFGEVMA